MLLSWIIFQRWFSPAIISTLFIYLFHLFSTLLIKRYVLIRSWRLFHQYVMLICRQCQFSTLKNDPKINVTPASPNTVRRMLLWWGKKTFVAFRIYTYYTVIIITYVLLLYSNPCTKLLLTPNLLIVIPITHVWSLGCLVDQGDTKMASLVVSSIFLLQFWFM